MLALRLVFISFWPLSTLSSTAVRSVGACDVPDGWEPAFSVDEIVSMVFCCFSDGLPEFPVEFLFRLGFVISRSRAVGQLLLHMYWL